MRKLFTSFFFCLFFFLSSRAQFFNYIAKNASIITTNTYTDLGTSGTKITTNFKGQPMTYDNDNSSVQNIGFPFAFAGNTFTQFVLNTNGFIKLGTDTTAISESFDVLSNSSSTATNIIYPFNLDLQPTVNSEYRVFTSGTVGSRKCTIQFRSLADSGCPVNCTPPSQIQYDAIEFQIMLYEGSNNVDFVFGNFTPNLNASGFVPANCGLKAGGPDFSINVTKSSLTAYTGAQFIEGRYVGNRFNTRNNILPIAGLTIRFTPIPVLPNNVNLQTFYTLGTIPKLLDHTAKIYVQNMGASNLTNFPVTMEVTGANTFSNTQTIANFPSGAKQLITFSSFSPANTGINNIKVSVPTDDDTSNNTIKTNQTVTNTTFGYGYGTTPNGNLGQSTTSMDLAMRVRNPIANTVTSITLFFDTVGRPFTVKILGVSSDTPKTTIYSFSGTKTSVAGANVLTPPTPFSVTGDFFVVVSQPSVTTSYRYSYQTEDPIREKTFYFRSPSANSSPWNDFAPLNPFRLMMNVTMGTTYTPIVLSSFTGYKESNKNILNWETASEQNNSGFEIQKSTDGTEFKKIGFVLSKAENGTSSFEIKYSFTDATPANGTNYYRLRQLDKDGKEFISNVVVLKSNVKLAEIVSLYPNPVKDNLNVSVNSSITDKVSLVITDITGRTVIQQNYPLSNGNNNIQVKAATLVSGVYLIKITGSDNNEIATEQFIKK
jgi:hypothetical protein